MTNMETGELLCLCTRYTREKKPRVCFTEGQVYTGVSVPDVSGLYIKNDLGISHFMSSDLLGRYFDTEGLSRT